MTLAITVDRRKIHQFCRKHHIHRMAFFGSVLRTDFDTESDVDVLVEFEPDHTPGLQFFAIQDELSKILGRNVDLNTPQFLPSNFRNDVMAGAEIQYEQA
jgi:predicted nucleotidyltransferase